MPKLLPKDAGLVEDIMLECVLPLIYLIVTILDRVQVIENLLRLANAIPCSPFTPLTARPICVYSSLESRAPIIPPEKANYH